MRHNRPSRRAAKERKLVETTPAVAASDALGASERPTFPSKVLVSEQIHPLQLMVE
jgi:hypothetical protein